MTAYEALALGLAIATVAMAILWWIHLRIGDAGIVDVGWTFLLGVLAVVYAAVLGDGLPARRWLVASVAGLWSLRLGVYLLKDRVLGADEDGRYRALRERWGDAFGRRMFFFFEAQAALAVLLSVEFLLVMRHPAPALRAWDYLGAAVLLVSIVGESIADRQLARWRKDPANRGRTCRTGLWRYSRHPNYFFEWVHWLAYVVMAVGAPWWWATWFAPALMYVFVRFVTGIPPTETQALKSRGDDYRAYQREVNAFFPGPVRAR